MRPYRRGGALFFERAAALEQIRGGSRARAHAVSLRREEAAGVLAMQCLSTLAVVRRETNSWRWPAFQFAHMTLLACGAALFVYQGGRLLGFE